jgi:protein-tyrosine phosphatase
MAEALLRRRLQDLGVDAQVASAGILSAGQPAHDYGVEALNALGIDMASHRSRTVSPELLLGADLILAMASEHVVRAAGTVNQVWPRTFTLKELVRRGERIGARAEGEPLADWLARAAEGRTVRDHMGSSSDLDVADPIGLPAPVYERLATELDDLLRRLVELVWGQEASARAGREPRSA